MTIKGFPEPVDTAPRLGEVHINPFTGELNLQAGDYGQSDMGDTFYIERRYVPGYLPDIDKPRQPLGRRWLINFIGTVARLGEKIWLPVGSFQQESFSLVQDEWQHDEAPNRYKLRETKEGFILTDHFTPAVYAYDRAGHLISVSRKGVPPRRIVYVRNTPQAIILSTGGRLELDFVDDYLTGVTDVLGRKVTYEYNDEGLLTKVTYPNYSNILYEYDGLGRLVSCIGQEKELIFRLSYDELGRLIRRVTNTGDIKVYNYVESDRRTIAMDKDTLDYRMYSWNRHNHIVDMVNVDGSEENFAYDEKGRITYRWNDSGEAIRLTYNEQGLLTKKNVIDGLTEEYEYNERGQLIAVRDSLGGVQEYLINENGWLTEKRTKLTAQDQRVEIWERDLAGRIWAYSLNGQRRQFAYEGLAPRPYLMELPDGGRFEYEYDHVNRLIKIKSPVGEKNFGYNALDLIAVETDALGQCKRYKYDLAGNLKSSESAPKLFFPGNSLLRTVTYDPAEAYKKQKELNIIYDAKGRITKVFSADNVVLALFTYDFGDRLTEERTRQNQTEAFRLRRFKYDTNDNVKEERIWLAGQQETGIRGKIQIISYTYDLMNRLISRKDNLGETVEFAYNELNRPIMQKIRRQNASLEVVKYIYDAIGRMVERDKKSDYARTGKLWERDFFTWDEAGNCVKAVLSDGTEYEGASAQSIYAAYTVDLPQYADISGYLTY